MLMRQNGRKCDQIFFILKFSNPPVKNQLIYNLVFLLRKFAIFLSQPAFHTTKAKDQTRVCQLFRGGASQHLVLSFLSFILSSLACEDDICTTSPWKSYNLFRLYLQAVHKSSQYNCTVVQLYSCTVVKLYSHTVVQSPSP